MQFRLTYQGPLTAHRDGGAIQKARAPEKHELRRHFHRQLKGVWEHVPVLREKLYQSPNNQQHRPEVERIADTFETAGFRFAPLVTRANSLICKLEVLMLRPGDPGDVLMSGDIDNRLKTIFDALKMPTSSEQSGHAVPQHGENPFFVLLEDDRLISHVSVEADAMYEPVNGHFNDVRLVINATIRPWKVTVDNLDYS